MAECGPSMTRSSTHFHDVFEGEDPCEKIRKIAGETAGQEAAAADGRRGKLIAGGCLG
jgi:hypothetical protein